jgi:hypothetical protein
MARPLMMAKQVRQRGEVCRGSNQGRQRPLRRSHRPVNNAATPDKAEDYCDGFADDRYMISAIIAPSFAKQLRQLGEV